MDDREKSEISFKLAESPKEFSEARDLFQLYADSLPVDLSFQDFRHELETLHIQYNIPGGALLLAYMNGSVVACVAFREITKETAELKRMYVKPECRGRNVGKLLLERILDIARDLQYAFIRLDTLPTMKTAQQLYRQFGFYEIAPYRYNPVEGTVYMEKKLV